mmetsp:Transcript_12396/g.14442  ORF Transcript_12396/g.14442 Transcript_12396/m.14442 type:complete len:715 (+) Transcript_12396:261-2405(+)
MDGNIDSSGPTVGGPLFENEAVFASVALFSSLMIAYVAYKTVRARSVETEISSPKENGDTVKQQDVVEEPEAGVKVSLYFGSQTGTAEGFAKDIAKAIKPFGYLPKVVDLEDFVPEEMSTVPYAVFLMATYGEGDPTDNALDFFSWLNDSEDSKYETKITENSFKDVKFAVFGLGNKQYEHYNKVGKTLNAKLGQLGGESFYEYGEGDDDDAMEDDFESWSEGLINAFKAMASLDSGDMGPSVAASKEATLSYGYRAISVPAPEDERLASLEGRLDAREVSSRYRESEIKNVDMTSRSFFEATPAKVVVNKELRQSAGEDGFGSTKHIEIDLQGTGVEYHTADNLAICPENDPELVKQAASFLGLNLNEWFHLEYDKYELGPLFPTPCTIKTALTCYISLNLPPSRATLGKLSHFATMQEHRERLRYLSSKEGKDEYHSRIVERKHDLVDIFEMFPSIQKPELGSFFEILPKLQPRYYTISSSSLKHPSRVHVTASIVTERKPGFPEGRIFKGACTHFLDKLVPREGPSAGKRPKDQRGKPAPWPQAYVFVRKSTFKLPQDITVPIILIGPGTGIAPMRAFIQERETQDSNERGDAVLFFGCRRETEDFIYRDELMKAVDDGILTKLHLAFSRQEAKKVYVQHLLKRESDAIFTYIEKKGAYIYVCGGTQMGKDVQHSLEEIIAQKGNMSLDESHAYVENLTKTKRYVQELWST